MPIGKLGRSVASDNAGILARRIRSLESQYQEVPPRFTIAGGYLVDDSAIGATSVNLNTFPQWARDLKIFLVIDAGTDECEIRKVDTLTGTTVGFTNPLTFAHLFRDPVLFISELFVDPKWFGAVGDGVSDDHSAFQAALDELVENGTGALKVPGGTYKINGTIDPNGASIIGSGMFGTHLHFVQNDNTDCIAVLGGEDNFVISDLTIYADVAGAGGSRFGVHLDDCSNVDIIRVRADTFTAGFYVAPGCSEILITECYVLNCTSWGMNCAVTDTRIVGNIVVDCEIGIRLAGTGPNICSENLILGSSSFGLNATSLDAIVYGNIIYGGSDDGIRSDLQHGFIIENNVIALNAPGNAVEMTQTEDGIITGNATDGNSTAFTLWTSNVNLGENASTEATKYVHTSVEKTTINDVHVEYIPAHYWTSMTGSPSLVNVGVANNQGYAWQFTTGNMRVGVWWRVPSNLIGDDFSMMLVVYWSALAGAAGNVRIYSGIANTPSGTGSPGATASTGSSVIKTTPSANVLYVGTVQTKTVQGYHTYYESLIPQFFKGGDVLRMYIGRDTAHVDDTYGGDIYIYGAEVLFR